MFGVDVVADHQPVFIPLLHQASDAVNALGVRRHVYERRQHVVAGLDAEQVKLDVAAQLGELSQALWSLDASCVPSEVGEDRSCLRCEGLVQLFMS